MNQPQLFTKVSIRGGYVSAGLRRKVPGTNPLLKPKVFSQSPKIQRPTIPSQKPQILSTLRLIHAKSAEKKTNK